jgi:hypothetical protein
MTRVSYTLFNSSTLSPVHCDQSHSDTCLCDLLTSNISVKNAYEKHGEKQTANARLPRVACLHAASLGYCYIVLAGAYDGVS